MARKRDTAELGERLSASVAAEAAAAEAESESEAGGEPAAAEAVEQPATVDAQLADEAEQGKTPEQLADELGLLMEGFEAGLRDLFGVAEPLVEIPLEGALGFMLPGSLDYRTHDDYRRCATCNGHGAILTGSLADAHQSADCPRCGGRGYLKRLEGEQPAGGDGEQNGAGGDGDPDAGYGVERWMGDPSIGNS